MLTYNPGFFQLTYNHAWRGPVKTTLEVEYWMYCSQWAGTVEVKEERAMKEEK